MHNNYYFIKRLSQELEAILVGSHLNECYSQEKDDLILRFDQGFVIRCHFTRSFSSFSFPKDPRRAKRNTVDIFKELLGARVEGIVQHTNERSFRIHFSDDYVLLIKLHGNNSNLLLYKGDQLLSLFKNNLQNDKEINYRNLDRDLTQDLETYNEKGLKGTFPTFGKEVTSELQRRSFGANNKDNWNIIQAMVEEMENSPNIYVRTGQNGATLSLFDPEDDFEAFTSPVEALNSFFSQNITKVGFAKEQSRLLISLSSKIKKTQSYITKVSSQLETLQKSNNYKIWGDNLMANLYNITKGNSKVTLSNVYDGKPLTIKINPRISVQENAKRYYQKHKNQHIELKNLKGSLAAKEEQLQRLKEIEEEVRNCDSIRDLRRIAGESDISSRGSEKSMESKPFWEKEVMGFRVLIGKNAKANDEMLRSYSKKNDLWLHAKDVPGSHVLITERSDQNFPKPVIERAAAYAAWYSKRKNDSLCPVICTPRKFVRKRKGDPPGAVIVEKEEVLMVVPEG